MNLSLSSLITAQRTASLTIIVLIQRMFALRILEVKSKTIFLISAVRRNETSMYWQSIFLGTYTSQPLAIPTMKPVSSRFNILECWTRHPQYILNIDWAYFWWLEEHDFQKTGNQFALCAAYESYASGSWFISQAIYYESFFIMMHNTVENMLLLGILLLWYK